MTPDMVMSGSYDYGLVALSIVISILASYAARDLSERVRNSRGGIWLIWLVGGATADAIGIWSMHYTGMMAFSLPVPVFYDWPTVVISLLVGILGSAAGLLVLSNSRGGRLRVVAASIFIGGVGISALHYTAMAAMRFQGMHHHSIALGVFSVALAIVICFGGLSLTFPIRDDAPVHGLRKHGGAWLRGTANPGMHYTAMAAVTFIYAATPPDLSHTVKISSLGIAGVSVVPVMLLFAVLLTSAVDRIRKQRVLLDELFEQAPEAVILMTADYRVVRVNREFTKLFGYSPKEAIGRHLRELIVPDELQDEFQRLIDMLARGERIEVDAIRRRKDDTRLYVSIVHVPVSLPGGQVATYAIYHDITERKKAEEKIRVGAARLRALSARLESAREEEGTRIAREIHDELGSGLTSLHWDLETLEKTLADSVSGSQLQESRERIEAMINLTESVLRTVRRISSELRPQVLDDLGLAEAVEWQATEFQTRTGIICNCDYPLAELNLNQAQATAVFRILQEALTNVLRHAEATSVDIKLKEGPGKFVMTIVDNGRGITEAELSADYSLGLLGMRERADLIGGTVDIKGIEGSGTTITIAINISA
jgi:PAS domain S-box-containing protein